MSGFHEDNGLAVGEYREFGLIWTREEFEGDPTVTCPACGREQDRERAYQMESPLSGEMLCCDCWDWVVEEMRDAVRRLQAKMDAASEREQQRIMRDLRETGLIR